jgi:hypothetical protein
VRVGAPLALNINIKRSATALVRTQRTLSDATRVDRMRKLMKKHQRTMVGGFSRR